MRGLQNVTGGERRVKPVQGARATQPTPRRWQPIRPRSSSAHKPINVNPARSRLEVPQPETLQRATSYSADMSDSVFDIVVMGRHGDRRGCLRYEAQWLVPSSVRLLRIASERVTALRPGEIAALRIKFDGRDSGLDLASGSLTISTARRRLDASMYRPVARRHGVSLRLLSMSSIGQADAVGPAICAVSFPWRSRTAVYRPGKAGGCLTRSESGCALNVDAGRRIMGRSWRLRRELHRRSWRNRRCDQVVGPRLPRFVGFRSWSTPHINGFCNRAACRLCRMSTKCGRRTSSGGRSVRCVGWPIIESLPAPAPPSAAGEHAVTIC